MKSLVEEASSVVKAIEKAWARAGKPQNFSVKIFEEPQSGFLGFNKTPAKIGIFFEEVKVETAPYKKNDRRPQHEGQRRSDKNRPQRSTTHHQPRHSEMKNNHPERKEREERHERPAHDMRDARDMHEGQQERPVRKERNNRRNRFEKPRSDFKKSEHRQPRRDAHNSAEVSEVVQSVPVQQPVEKPAEVAPQRKVLRVSSRRYTAPAKNGNDQSGNN